MQPFAFGICGSAALSALFVASYPGAVRAQSSPTAVNVHTTRERDQIEPLLRVFEGLTRIKLDVVYLAADPLARLTADASAGKADLFIAADLGQLAAAKAAGLTEPVSNTDLTGRVPEAYRDPEGHWLGLTRRLRVVAVSRTRVTQKALTYEELADNRWKGRLCMRSGHHADNVMLVASIIAHKGAELAERWLRGVKSNLAGKPGGSDRDQVAAIAAGSCDVALVDASDVGRLRSGTNDAKGQAAGNAVEVVLPNAADRGTHAGISGMALIKDAPGINNAALLMDFLTSEPAQIVYSRSSFELPVRIDVKPSGWVESWGTPTLDPLPLDELVKQQAQAVGLINKVGFDNGPGS